MNERELLYKFAEYIGATVEELALAYIVSNEHLLKLWLKFMKKARSQ